MNLLFDLMATQPFGTVKRHGGGKYAEVIFRRMVERSIDFCCFYDSARWILPELISICKDNNIKLYDLSQVPLTQVIKDNNIDVLYTALPEVLGKVSGCHIIGTIHGLRDFETPFDNIFYNYSSTFKEFLKFTIKKIFPGLYHLRMAKVYHSLFFNNKNFTIVTVSEHSRYAINTYFPELRDKSIPVFYSPNTSIDNVLIEDRSLAKENYFLLVSGKIWRKNNLRAIIAFDRLISYGLVSGFRMKVTGASRHDFKYKIKNPDSFDFLGYVDEQELAGLYKNANVFVYPSLNEGFGYPPLEAMRYGVPVIASPFTSIAEICAGGALYFNPYSVEEIMNRMQMIIEPNCYKNYSSMAKARYDYIRNRQNLDLDRLIDYIIAEK